MQTERAGLRLGILGSKQCCGRSREDTPAEPNLTECRSCSASRGAGRVTVEGRARWRPRTFQVDSNENGKGEPWTKGALCQALQLLRHGVRQYRRSLGRCPASFRDLVAWKPPGATGCFGPLFTTTTEIVRGGMACDRNNWECEKAHKRTGTSRWPAALQSAVSKQRTLASWAVLGNPPRIFWKSSRCAAPPARVAVRWRGGRCWRALRHLEKQGVVARAVSRRGVSRTDPDRKPSM